MVDASPPRPSIISPLLVAMQAVPHGGRTNECQQCVESCYEAARKEGWTQRWGHCGHHPETVR